jgi:succinyl-diaminopimelate desuccinylase
MNYSQQIAKLSDWIKRQESLYTELQNLLISHSAVGPESEGDGEWEKAKALTSWLRKRGIEPEGQYHSQDSRVSEGQRPNFYIRLPGSNASPRLWIMTHLDVVPPGDAKAWNHNPFSPLVKKGRIYGRGSEDNNQGLAMSVLVYLAFVENSLVPPVDVNMLFVSDEEVSSSHGIGHVLNQGVFRKDDYFLVPDGGDPEGILIEIAEKSIMWIKFTVKGVQCHASEPEKGNNAFVAGSALVLALQELKEIFKEENKIFNPPASTFEPTRKTENQQNINTIPGEDVFYMDCRILPEQDKDAVKSEIKRICNTVAQGYNVSVSFEVSDSMFSGATPEDHILVRAMKKAIKETKKKEARVCGFGGGTVAAWLRRKNFPAIVWSSVAGMAHMPNEFSITENAISDAATLAAFIMFLEE